MEKKQTIQHVMNYGLITGLVLIAYSLLLYIIGQSLNQLLEYLAIVILAYLIYLFSKIHRDKINEGILPYGKGFTLGFLIGFFAGIILSFFSYIQITLIDPSLVDKQLELMEQKFFERGMSEEQVEAAINISKKWMTPVGIFFGSLLSFSFWSAIIALITAAILKKDPSPFTPDVNNE